jgi:hypothetical protein
MQPIMGLLAISSQLTLAASECKRNQKRHNLVEALWEGGVHDIQVVMSHIPRYHVSQRRNVNTLQLLGVHKVCRQLNQASKNGKVIIIFFKIPTSIFI